jgi:hypothetical protein
LYPWQLCQLLPLISLGKLLLASFVYLDLEKKKEFMFVCLFGRDRMVVGFTTTHAISAHHQWCCEFEYRSGRGVQYYVIKVCQWLATGRWFSLGLPVSSINKTDHDDITEILLKVALNTIRY